MTLASRAPAAWRREMARLALPWTAVRRGARWLPELLGPPPRLREEPLYGRTLAALVDALAATDDTPPAAAPRRSSARAEAERAVPPGLREPAGRQRRRRRRAAGVEPAPRETGRAPLPQDAAAASRRAAPELLSRLAGRTPPADPESATATPRRAPWRPEEAARARRREALGDDRSPSRRLADLADRGVARVRRGVPAGQVSSSRAAAAPVPDGPIRPAATALDGETAPRRLLERWLRPDDGSSGARRRPAESPSPERRAPSPSTPNPGAALRRAAGPARDVPPPATPGVSPAPQALESPRALPPDLEPRPPAASRPRTPDAAALPPPLLPATAAGFSPAAARRVLGAVRPGAAAEEDVGDLAERLGRYLAEEARRHGIDV